MANNSDAPKTTNDMIDEMHTLLQPWLNAARSWVDESEKMHQAAADNMTAMMDNGHRIAKQNLDLATTFNATLRKQMMTQMAKGYDAWTNAIPR